MNVRQLIEFLRAMPPDLEVEAWDHEQDEYELVTGVIFEDGSSRVSILVGEAGIHAMASMIAVCGTCSVDGAPPITVGEACPECGAPSDLEAGRDPSDPTANP